MSEQSSDNDTSVMFEIGVTESPSTKKNLEELAKLVENYQERMATGMGVVGQSAGAVTAAVNSVLPALRDFRVESVNAASEVRSAMSALRAEMQIPFKTTVTTEVITQTTTVPVPASAGVPAGGQMHPSGAGYSPSLPSTVSMTPTVSVPQVAPSSAPSVVKVSGGARMPSYSTGSSTPKVEADELIDTFDEAMEEVRAIVEVEITNVNDILEESIREAAEKADNTTEQLRSAYEEQMVASSEAYAAMADDLDGYLATHGSAADKIAANMRKAEYSVGEYRNAYQDATREVNAAAIQGVKSSLMMARGMAEIGLVSENNMESFLKSIVVIQGVFDLLEGGANMVDGISKGWLALNRQSEAANKLLRVEQALKGQQFASMKVYQSQLATETTLANAAAAANTRLAVSRNVGGVASAGGAATAVAGVSGRAGGALSGLGAIVTGGLSIKLMALVAAAGAAATSLLLLRDAAKGQFSRPGTFSGWYGEKHANAEVYLARAFRTDKQIMADMPDGREYAVHQQIRHERLTAAQESRAILESAQRRRNTIEIESEQGNASAARATSFSANYSSTMFRSDTSVPVARLNAQAASNSDALAENQRLLDQYRSGVSMSPDEVKNIKEEIDRLNQSMVENVQIQQQAATVKEAVRDTFEAETQASLREEIDKKRTELNSAIGNKDFDLESKKAIEQHILDLQGQVEQSLERQKSIASESANERLAAEEMLQQRLKSRLDLEVNRIAQLDATYRGAAKSYVDMTEMERSQVDTALERARTEGADKLNRFDRSYLSRIDTEESRQILDESYKAEAKRLGFEDRWGKGMLEERDEHVKVRDQLKAQIETSYDVAVEIKIDESAIVSTIVQQFGTLMEDKLKVMQSTIVQEMDEKLRNLAMETEGNFNVWAKNHPNARNAMFRP